MGAKSKRAQKIRAASEFDLARLVAQLKTAKDSTSSVYAWCLADIMAARNAQMRGDFRMAARLAESTRTDDALFVAFKNRCAPQECIKRELTSAKGARGKAIADEAEPLYGPCGIGATAGTLVDIEECLVNHNVAFATMTAQPRLDGARVDFYLTYWPIEFVRWDPTLKVYLARVDQETVQPGDLSADPAMQRGYEIPIVHGDGRWIIFNNEKHEAFKSAPLLSAALVWARHAFSMRDWSKSSLSHGLAKVIGELPAGVPLQQDGGLTPEAAAFQELLLAIANSDLPVGIRPAGSKTDFVANNSTAWQIFVQLAENAEKAAARIYLGTDGVLGAQGGAPGVDITALLGVATTRVQGDLGIIERGLNTAIEIWTAVNFGDSKLAPKTKYLLPDTDADAARESRAKRTDAFYAEIEKARANGFDVTQEYADTVAEKYGIEAPTLPAVSTKGPSITLAPTDIARVVTVNEARASAGVGQLVLPSGAPDPDGQLTVEQFAVKKAAQAQTAADAAAAAAQAATAPPQAA